MAYDTMNAMKTLRTIVLPSQLWDSWSMSVE